VFLSVARYKCDYVCPGRLKQIDYYCLVVIDWVFSTDALSTVWHDVLHFKNGLVQYAPIFYRMSCDHNTYMESTHNIYMFQWSLTPPHTHTVVLPITLIDETLATTVTICLNIYKDKLHL